MNSDYHNADGSSSRKCAPCARVRAEFVQAPFEVVEISGDVIDVQRSFAPQPFLFVLFLKIVITAISLDTLVRDLFLSDDAARAFYLAYLTHWGLVIAEAYNLISLACTILPYPEQPVNGAPTSFLIRMAWGGFSLTASLQAVIVVLYWSGVYVTGDEVGYFGFMKHGGILILVLLEGLMVNRVPVRISHLRFPIALLLLYAIWSVIHNLFTDIGNPNANGQPGDDDAIYVVMNWKKRPGPTAVVFVLAVFVLTPILFLMIYILSLPLRRYVVNQRSISVAKNASKPKSRNKFASV